MFLKSIVSNCFQVGTVHLYMKVCPSSVRPRKLLVKTYIVHDDTDEDEEKEGEGEEEDWEEGAIPVIHTNVYSQLMCMIKSR